MSTTYFDTDDKYRVTNKSANIKVTVAIGEGQPGAYLIFLDGATMGADQTADLGKGGDCIGKTVTIVVTVRDALDETNLTSTTVNFLVEGSNPCKFGPYKKEAGKHLDTVIYTIKIKVHE